MGLCTLTNYLGNAFARIRPPIKSAGYTAALDEASFSPIQRVRLCSAAFDRRAGPQ